MSTINNLIRFNWVSIGLFLILFTTKLSANCEPVTIFPFTEDFEGAEFPPPCWTSYDGDGDGTRWERSEVEKYNGLASAQHGCGDCESTQEGWLVTPPLFIPAIGNYVLKFWSYNINPQENFYNGVWISTEDNDPELSTFIELKQLSTSTSLSTSSSEDSDFWKEIIVPLSDYAGQTIYIGFKYEGDCADTWYIDDIEVSMQDIVILTQSLDDGVEGIEYSQTLEALGNLPITWAVTEGTLPDGLDLSTDGVISGTPTNVGLFNFTVDATNHTGSYSIELSITIELNLITLTELLSNTTNVINYTLGNEYTLSGYTNNYVEGNESMRFRFNDRNYYAVVYKISLSAGNLIQIYSSKENGDSYLILYRANGEEYQYVTYDDDSGEGLDSYINITIEVSGDYYIVLTDIAYDKPGNYSIIVSVHTAYSVTYNLNGGTGTTPIESDKAEGETFTAASTNNIVAPQGKRFKEWNTEQDGSGTAYSPGAKITMPDYNIFLYAIWEDIPPPTYIVNVTNGEGSGRFAAGETVYITADLPTADRVFVNWIATSPGVTFDDAKQENTFFIMPANSVSVMAVFQVISSNIEFYNIFTSVYPNPTDGLFTLQFESEGEYNVTINNISGKTLLRQTVSGLSVQMDISSYPAGVYLLTVDNGKQQSTKRVVKK